MTMDPARARRRGVAVDPAQGFRRACVVTRQASSTPAMGRGQRLRERYADRIVARLARQIPNLERDQGACGSLAGRPGAGERQPPSRRSLRRVARSRPELPLAALPGEPGTCDRRRQALAYRREHAPRAGARCRLGDVGRAAALLRPALPRRAGSRLRGSSAVDAALLDRRSRRCRPASRRTLRAYREAGAEESDLGDQAA